MAVDNTVHISDTKTAIVLEFWDLKEDGTEAILPIDQATKLEALLQKSDDNETVFVATMALRTDGLDGQAVYLTDQADFNIEGTWKIQGYVEIAGGAWYTDILEFTVAINLQRPVV